MSEVLQGYRDRFPKYQGVDDETLAEAIYQNTPKYREKMSRPEFDTAIGLKRAASTAPQNTAPPFDPEGPGAVRGGGVRPITDETELQSTGLPAGASQIEVGRQHPDFEKLIAGTGRDSRVVKRGDRYFTTGRATTNYDDNMGGEFQGNDPEAEMRDQLPVERTQLGEAPGKARESAGFALDEVEGYKRALGPGAQVRRVQTTGPLKDRIVYRMSDNEPWTTVAKPGLGVTGGDLRSMLGEALPTLGGMAGGVAGTFTGAPVAGTVVGTGLGAAAGEFARIAEGFRRGVIPPETSAMDVALAVGKRAGLDAAGAGAGVALFKAYKLFARRGLPDIGMTEEQFLNEWKKRSAGLDQRGKDLMTTGDVVGDTPAGARIKAAEERLQRDANPAADVFRERQQAKDVYGRERLESELPFKDSGVTPTNLGEGVAAAAPDAEAALNALGRRANPDVGTVSRPIRSAIQRAEATAENNAREIYGLVDRGLAGRTIKPVRTDIAIKEYGNILENDVFKTLGEEDRKLVTNWAKEAFDETGQLKNLDYATLDRGIKSMRRAIRSSHKGEWNGDLEMLSNIEEQLVADRARLIEQTPGGARISKQLSQAESSWRDIKTQFRRTKLQDFFTLRSGGRSAMGDEAIGGRLFNDPETARVVGGILKDPQFAAERESARMMLRWEVARAAKPDAGDISDASLKAMLRDNYPVLRNFFSVAELNSLSNPIHAQRLRKAMGVSKLENPTEWFEKFWSRGNVRDAGATMDRLRSVDPDMAKAVQGFAQQKIFADLTTDAASGAGKTFDPAKFEKLLDQDNGQRAEWLGRVLDPGFGARLRSISEAMQTLNPKHAPINNALPQEPGAFGMARRFGRAVLGPLSTEGRRYNLAVAMMGEKVRRRSMEAILDPQVYASLLSRGKVTRTGRAAAGALGQEIMRGATANE